MKWIITVVLGMALAGLGAAQTQHRAAVRQQQMLYGYLGLSDAQKAQAKSIFDGAKTAAQPVRAQIKESKADLRAAIAAGKPVNEIAAKVGALTGQLIAIRAGAQEQFRALLTPEQINKLQQLGRRGK